MKRNITAHVAVERFDRISYIIDTIGLGEEILFDDFYKIERINEHSFIYRLYENEKSVSFYLYPKEANPTSLGRTFWLCSFL